MSDLFSDPEVRRIGCEVFTPTTYSTGELVTKHSRFSDALNSIDQDYVELRNVKSCPLLGDRVAEARSALIRRESVVLVIPSGQQDAPDRSSLRWGQLIEKRAIRVGIEASPFQIEGTVHVPVGVDLLQYAHESLRTYVPVTNVTLSGFGANPAEKHFGFAMLNRRFINMIVALEANITSDDHPALDSEPRPKNVEAQEVASTLMGTEIFAKAPMGELASLCTQLLASRLVMRLAVPEGATLIRQDEEGRALHIIESGVFGVQRTSPRDGNAVIQVARLTAGDCVGEMAILGDGRRSASVVAVEAGDVLVVHAEGMSTLMQRFPTATSALLRLMVKRNGGLADRSPAAELQPLSALERLRQGTRPRGSIDAVA